MNGNNNTSFQSPLFELVASKVEPFFFSLYQFKEKMKETKLYQNVNPFLNILTLCQLFFCAILMSEITNFIPIYIFLLGCVGVLACMIAIWLQDPLLMLLYSKLNLIGFIYTCVMLFLNGGYYSPTITSSCCFLFVAQVKSLSFVMKFYARRLKNKEQEVASLSQSLYQATRN